MKKYLIIILLFVQVNILFSQSPGWTTISDTSFFDYNFSSPGIPSILDTLGIKHYSYVLNSTIGIQVLAYKYPPFDSTNVQFMNALRQSGGDTIKAITDGLFGTTNSTTLNSQVLSLTNGLRGIEVNLKYNTLNQGKVVISYARFFYRKDFLLTFSITGYQDDQTILDTTKNQFFNSISF